MKIQRFFTIRHVLILLFSSLLLFPLQELFSQNWVKYVKEQTKGNENNFYAVQKAFNEYWKDKAPEKGVGYKQFRRWEWFWESRVNADGTFPDNDIVVKEWNKYLEQYDDSPLAPNSTGNWSPLGPNSSDGGNAGIGRINCIAFHPTNFNTFWVGTPAGGLWKTTNFGSTWTTVTDNMPVLGVSDIAINPNNPNIMYIATGDGDGGSLGSCTGSSTGDTKSIGILKSIDGGQTWNQTGMNWSVTEEKLIRRLIINPSDPNILYAAASDGIWKTTNGGTSWTNIFDTDPVTYFMDIEFKPGSPNTIYASTYTWEGNAEVKISYDGGNSWYTTSLVDDIVRINLAVSAASPNLIEGICANTNGAFAGWVESTDGFNNYSWYAAELGTGNLLSGSYPLTTNSTTGQGGYDLAYAINPTNSNERFLGGIVTYKTADGWSSNLSLANFWAGAPNGNPGVPIVHADKHFIVFHPLNPSYLFECNDGGIYWTNNGGTTWNDISNGLQISQIYRIGNSATDAQDIMCGLQDNGTKEYYNGTWYDWTGGDGMECAVDPTSNLILYSSYINGEIYRTLDGWNTYTTISENLPGGQQPGAWVTPYVIDQNNPQILYAGYVEVYKSSNRGDSWNQISMGMTQGATLRSIAVSQTSPQTIYAAKFSAIYKTINGGGSWTNITSGLPPYPARISYIAISPTDANTVFVSLSGYAAGYKVFKSTNGGSSWTNISGSLPDIPVNCIVYENGSNEGLYIGTDVGVYYKDASMSDWIYYSTGLPNVVVTELDIQYSAGKLRAATFGRGLWESDLYFASSYQIATNSNPSNGGSTSGGGTFNQGETCTVIATANPTWNFTNWTENGNVVSTSANYSFTVSANSTLTANFTQQQTYTISTAANPPAAGSTTGGGTFTNGQQCTVNASSNAGYDFINWTENGSIVSTSASFTFNVTGNRNLIADFSQQQFIVSTSSMPSNGGSTSGGGTYYYGASVTVLATANSGWTFISWTENGTIVSTSPSFSFLLFANKNLVANFATQYNINANANPGAGGYTTGGGTYTSGTQATLNAFPNSGWAFINWTEFGSQVSTNPEYSFVVNSNRDLTANFLQQYTINASASPALAGYTTGGGIYTTGQIATLKAFANPDYAFYSWTENGNIVSSNSTYSFTVNNNRTLVATFLSTLGVNEQESLGVMVYPNPATNILTVEVQQGFTFGIESYELMDASGQVLSVSVDKQPFYKKNIDTSKLSDGIYILKIKLQNGSYENIKVVIKNN